MLPVYLSSFHSINTTWCSLVIGMATERSATGLNGLREWAPLLIRIALGIVFLISGVGKALGVGPKANPIPRFAGFLGELGVPAPGASAWLVALTELLGGVFLLLGVLTRLSAIALAITMLVAVVLVHLPNGFASSNGGYEYAMVLMLACISLVLSGPGRLSVGQSVMGGELLPRLLGLGSGEAG